MTESSTRAVYEMKPSYWLAEAAAAYARGHFQSALYSMHVAKELILDQISEEDPVSLVQVREASHSSA